MARATGKGSLMLFLVLNLVAEAPMHPYQMKRLTLLRGNHRLLGVNPDSLYHAVAQLERGGLIEPVESYREGRRPERTVYRITGPGSAKLRGWTRWLLSEATGEYPGFLAALAHLASVPPEECRELLEQRALQLERQISELGSSLCAARGQRERVLVIDAEYARAMKLAELSWTRSVISDIASGRLTWDPKEIRHRFAGYPPEEGRLQSASSLVQSPHGRIDEA